MDQAVERQGVCRYFLWGMLIRLFLKLYVVLEYKKRFIIGSPIVISGTWKRAGTEQHAGTEQYGSSKLWPGRQGEGEDLQVIALWRYLVLGGGVLLMKSVVSGKRWGSDIVLNIISNICHYV